MSVGRILVIAPNRDFRRSLAFALETEGYAVETECEIPSEDQLQQRARFAAVVLDRKAIRQDSADRTIRVGNQEVPVILLASPPEDWKVFRTIPTPLMGSALSDAVTAAVTAVPVAELS